MKLAGLDIHDLRRALRRHPDVGRHVPDLDRIERMRAAGLLGLAKKLGVDAKTAIEVQQKSDRERQDWSHKFPAFEDVLDLDLTVELLGKRVTRKVRVQYGYTPEWEYHDLLKGAPYLGWPMSSLRVKFRTVPDEDGSADNRPDWEGLGILDIGEVYNLLEDEIERRCKAEDAKRRRAATRKRRDPAAHSEDNDGQGTQ